MPLYTIRSGATITATIRWTDVQGVPASVSGPTTWESTDESLITVTADQQDSTIARITSVGPLGTCQVIASAATTSGAEIRTQADIGVLSADATTGTILVQGSGPAIVPPLPPPAIIRG